MNFNKRRIARLMRLNYWQISLVFVIAAVLMSIVIVVTIDLLWDGKFSAELEFAGIVTPAIDASIMMQLTILLLIELKGEASHRQRTEELLNESQRIARIGNWSRNLDTGLFTWSEKALHIFEIEPDKFDGTYGPLLQRVHPEDRAMVEATYRRNSEIGEPYEITYRLLFSEGRIKHVFARGALYAGGNGRGRSLIGIVQDVTERVLLEEELRRLATTDALTGIPNRHHFNNLFRHELERSQRYGVPLSLIMFDIDQFKSINDTYGHATGDRVLVHVASVVRDALRSTDVVARWGGEEFMVLAPHTGLDEAVNLAERLREIVARSRHENVSVTISIGVTTCHEAPSADWVLRCVDDLLYRAKSSGRNRIEAHSSDAPGLLNKEA